MSFCAFTCTTLILTAVVLHESGYGTSGQCTTDRRCTGPPPDGAGDACQSTSDSTVIGRLEAGFRRQEIASRNSTVNILSTFERLLQQQEEMDKQIRAISSKIEDIKFGIKEMITTGLTNRRKLFTYLQFYLLVFKWCYIYIYIYICIYIYIQIY